MTNEELVARVRELEAERDALRKLLREAVQTIRELAGQQSMDDPWWTECANRIDAVLAGEKP